MSQIAEYDKYLNDKMQEIRDRLSGGKLKIDVATIGVQKRRGRVKDKRLHLVCETFGITLATYKNYRSGRGGLEKQRLYALWYSIPLEIFEELKDKIK